MKISQKNSESVPTRQLKGVGAQIASRLEKMGIHSITDLLFHLPFRYEDRTQVLPIGGLVAGQKSLVDGQVKVKETLVRPRRTLVCKISDGTGLLTLRFFYFNATLIQNFTEGARVRCFGEVRYGFNGSEMIHPEYQAVLQGETLDDENALTPVYYLTEGIRQTLMRKLVASAIDWWKERNDVKLQDWLPAIISERMGFPSLEEAVNILHAPPAELSIDQLTAWIHPAQQRLVFEELIAHYLCLSQAKLLGRQKKAKIFRKQQNILQNFLGRLPFDLTNAQKRVIDETYRDLNSGHPMMRLIHGDVGSGKTLVAVCCALAILSEGWQVAVMAPTELLAEQHFNTINQWLIPMEFQVGFLSGSQTEKNRRDNLKRVQSGVTDLVIGTHALFQESVEFSKLGLVVIDEQHRFGVHQRLALRDKGVREGCFPHQLVMTATPIPRTLAMLRFADLDVSVIDELPPGRTPVTTSVIPASRRAEVIERIAEWIATGHQAYWVCTLIEESELLQCEAAEKTCENLAKALSGIRVGLVHGKLTSTEKETAMQQFIRHEVDLLVATTVIEVGVDVPNADLMVIENPERLGLAQLHQLRGRVGRGSKTSYCLLMYQAPLSNLARERLSILRESNDGFRIAEKDLEIRGPGDVMGTRQTGQIQFKLADLGRDKHLMDSAVAAAQQIQAEYPQNIDPLVQRWIGDATQYTDV